ncbi:uncharacterized protein LOC144361659 [Saccoglossus kowalevskii]
MGVRSASLCGGPNGVEAAEFGAGCLTTQPVAGAINWPDTGSKVQIWSLLSRKKDGFLRVTDTPLESEQGAHTVYKVDAKGKLDKENTMFQLYQLPQTTEDVSHPTSQNILLGMPGEHINKDSNTIYVLTSWPLDATSDEDRTLAAMKFDLSDMWTDPVPWPHIRQLAQVADSVRLTAIYNQHTNFYEIRDHIENVGYENRNEERYHYLRAEGSGVVRRVGKRTSHQQPFSNNPATLFYITDLGSDSHRENGANETE